MAGEEFVYIGSMFVSIGIFIFFVVLMVTVITAIEFNLFRKSRRYRKELSDMYVAGKIRKLAKRDDIKIEEEYKIFKKWEKKQSMEFKELDNAVEQGLKEKLAEDVGGKPDGNPSTQ